MKLADIKEYSSSGESIFNMKLRVVYYARVSTEKDEQLNSLENQKQYYEEYIRANSNWTFIDNYIDEGISGTSVNKRNDFLRMIEDAKNQRFDLIITKEISRFSRNTLDSIKYTRLLKSYGVGVYFQNDNINTLDSDGELRLTIMAAIAQEEVNKLSKRTRFGFKKAQENGVLLGQNNLYGYSKVEQRLVINEDEAVVVRRIFYTYIAGKLGLRAIANQLDAENIKTRNGKSFSYNTLCQIIKNPKYKGYYAGGKYSSIDYNDKRKLRVEPDKWVVFKDDRIPAIIDEEIWDKANQLLVERGQLMKEHADAVQSRYTYSGKLICAEHGTTYHRHVYKSKRRGDVECWNCKLYRLKGKEAGCDSPTIYSYELDEILADIYKDMFSKRDDIINEYLHDIEQIGSITDYSKEKSKTQKELENIQKKKDKLLELVTDGSINNSEFKKRNNELNEQIQEAEQKLLEIENEIKKKSNNKTQLEQLRKLLEKQWDSNGAYNSEITGVILDHIVVAKEQDKQHIKLDIYLKIGEQYQANIERQNRKNSSITLCQMPISSSEMIKTFKRNLSAYRGYYDAVFKVNYILQ